MTIKQGNLALSANFCFNKTIAMLQRGSIDPTNIIHTNTWLRCFYYQGEPSLIGSYLIDNDTLLVKVLYGDIPITDAINLVSSTLGLDDKELGLVKDLPFAEKLIDVAGLTIPGYPNLFEAIVQIIMGQQISVAAANNIRAKFTLNLGSYITYAQNDYYIFPKPEKVLEYSITQLQALGLSQNKAKAVLNVASACASDPEVLGLNLTSDPSEIRRILTKLYGVGNWTVDWLLIRLFRHFEFIPETDLAVCKAFSWWFDRATLMTPKDVKKFEQLFYPFGGAVAFRVLYAYSVDKLSTKLSTTKHIIGGIS